MANQSFEAWAAREPKGELTPYTYKPRPLGEHDVEIKITHCGICYSDISQIDSGWGPSIYPIVPGHEIVGHVDAVGSKVTSFKVGDRVGVGAQALSCLKTDGSCQGCGSKLEQYCNDRVFTYNAKYPDGEVAYGGYQKKVRVHSHFTFHIPANLPSAEVAPLFCAGATVFEPLKHFNIGKGHKVGVIGIGGLGHLAIKFAAALGATVTGISRTHDKKPTALALGAHNYVASTDEKEFKAAIGSLDFIISTDNVTLDLDSYLSLLKLHGTIVLVGLPEKGKLCFSGWAVFAQGVNISGSAIASPSRIEEMLKLASEHNVLADVQVFDISKVNEALLGVRQGKPRFRYVLKIQDA